MKNSNVVSSSVLLFNGLLFLVLGARVWSAPDVFAGSLGPVPSVQSTIDALAAIHAGSFVALGIAALAAVFTTAFVRWLSLLALTAAGIAAHLWLWSFTAGNGGDYETVLRAAFVINVVTLVTAFLGEPLFGAGANRTNAGDGGADLRWG